MFFKIIYGVPKNVLGSFSMGHTVQVPLFNSIFKPLLLNVFLEPTSSCVYCLFASNNDGDKFDGSGPSSHVIPFVFSSFLEFPNMNLSIWQHSEHFSNQMGKICQVGNITNTFSTKLERACQCGNIANTFQTISVRQHREQILLNQIGEYVSLVTLRTPYTLILPN